MNKENIIAHPILTGSIYPIRANTLKPLIQDPDTGSYQLQSESNKSVPSGLLARLFAMSALNRMLHNGTSTVHWNNNKQLLDDMNTGVSGVSIRQLRYTLESFNNITIATPQGSTHLRCSMNNKGITASADDLLVEIFYAQGVSIKPEVINLLRGRGIGGVPIDLYAWLTSLTQIKEFDSTISWTELEQRFALARNKNFPLYFSKSLDMVTEVFHDVSVVIRKEGVHFTVL